MAKKKPGRGKAGSSTKAQAIRDEFSSRGASARPKDVIAALKSKGVVVSSAQVSNIKASLGKKKRGRKAAAAHSSNGMISLDILVEAKKLAARIGGIDAARKALDALSKLS